MSYPFQWRADSYDVQQHPPEVTTADGTRRRVGVEIEFAKLPLDRAAIIVADMFGGDICQDAPFAFRVTGTRVGDFGIELDSQYAQPSTNDGGSLGAAVRDKIATVIGNISKAAVPSEITCPPVTYDSLGEIAALMDALARAGAAGTDESVFYAFGLQFNPEIPRPDAAAITATLKSYLLLSDWLRSEMEVDTLRNLLTFAAPFPMSYRTRLAAPGYAPPMAQLIDDYLAENATRNRELDMLPLFAYLDLERVRGTIDDPRIKPRPTYHYRLPNAVFNRAGGHLLREWGRWVTVERIAADKDLLGKMAAAFLATAGTDFDATRWAERCADWVESCALGR